MHTPHDRLLGLAVLLGLGFGLAVPMTGSGCSSGAPTAGSGGTASGSGAVSGGLGGKTSAGGTTAFGGMTSTGGTTPSGGAMGEGGKSMSGGTTGSGGISASGGAMSSGGAGGAAAAGGAVAGRGGAAADVGGNGSVGRGGSAGRNAGNGGSTGAGGSTIPTTITLTSPVLTEGGAFAAGNTCADPGMSSPELDWTPGPSGTMSYAVTLTDLTSGDIHWAIWNIPVPSGASTAIILPANLDTIAMLTTPMGAIQVNRVNGKGYYGPCLTGETHTFQFQVYAIPTASLAGMNTSTDAADASIRAVATATGTLTATSNAHH